LLKNDGVHARPFVLENQLFSILLEWASVNKKSKMGLEDRTKGIGLCKVFMGCSSFLSYLNALFYPFAGLPPAPIIL
jgi:hypothetical protein